MSAQEQNKALVQAYVAAFNNGDLQTLRSLFTPGARIQGVLGAALLDKAVGIWRELIEGLGINLAIEDMVAEGNRVAVRYIERGTFKGPFMGHPPTGKSYEIVAIEWFVIEGGKIRERWGARDSAAQARQIGLPLT